jgi:hypothetical protein
VRISTSSRLFHNYNMLLIESSCKRITRRIHTQRKGRGIWRLTTPVFSL